MALMAVLALLYIANHKSTFFSVRGSTYNQSRPIREIVKSTRNHKVDFSEGSDECLSSSDSLLFDTSIASAAEATELRQLLSPNSCTPLPQPDIFTICHDDHETTIELSMVGGVNNDVSEIQHFFMIRRRLHHRFNDGATASACLS